MQSAYDMLPTLSNKIIADNPQIEEHRCRICYEDSKPLITLCECSGTIAYVHEDCILDWITKKMENSEVVEIPKCEICRAAYSAKLKIGKKKVCPKLLMKKIKELKVQEILTSLIYLIGVIFAVVIASKAMFQFFGGILAYNATENGSDPNIQNKDGFLVQAFKCLFFPLFFARYAVQHGKKRIKLLDEARVQIVEVTLNPKLIIKN